MPVMNDYEATAAIRSLPGEKGTEDVHRRNCISFVIQWLHLNTAR